MKEQTGGTCSEFWCGGLRRQRLAGGVVFLGCPRLRHVVGVLALRVIFRILVHSVRAPILAEQGAFGKSFEMLIPRENEVRRLGKIRGSSDNRGLSARSIRAEAAAGTTQETLLSPKSVSSGDRGVPTETTSARTLGRCSTPERPPQYSDYSG